MSVYHSAYLFSPEEYAATINRNIENPDSVTGYQTLRGTILRLFDSNANVRILAADYGGWDKSEILAAFPLNGPKQGERSIDYLFLLLLYGHFKSDAHQLGLGHNEHLLEGILQKLKWKRRDSELLRRGYNFGVFAKTCLDVSYQPSHDSDLRTPNWDNLHTLFQSGWIGWLPLDDIESLLKELIESQQLLFDLGPKDTSNPNSPAAQEAFRSALEMLTAARDQNCGLCLIISG